LAVVQFPLSQLSLSLEFGEFGLLGENLLLALLDGGHVERII
jgi:hypothetical protein